MRLAFYIPLFLFLFVNARSALAQDLSIAGKVTDSRGDAVGNTPVSLVADDGRPIQQQTTGTDGQFTFTGIRSGKYTLKLNVAGFDPVNRPLLVRDGEPLTIDDN